MNNRYLSIFNDLSNKLIGSFIHNNSDTENLISILINIEKEINSYKEFQKSLNNTSDSALITKEAIKYHTNITRFIDQVEEIIKNSISVENEIRNFEELLEHYFSSSEKIYEEEQSKERFRSEPKEKLWWRLLKLAKFIVFVLSTSHIRFINVFKILFKKQPIPIKYWKHKIYLDKISRIWILYPFLTTFVQSKVNFFIKLIEQLTILMESEYETIIQPSNIISLDLKWDLFFKELKDEFSNSSKAFINKNESLFIAKIGKSGTIELPYSTLKLQDEKIRLKTFKNYLSQQKKWNITINAVLEKWKIRQLLFSTSAHVNIQATQFYFGFKEKFKNKISQAINDEAIILNELKDEFSAIKEPQKSSIRSFVVKSIYKINKTLAQEVSKISDLLFAQNLLNITDKLEIDINTRLNSLPEKAILVKSGNFISGIDESDISYFSLKEFIEFDSLNQFSLNILKLKQNLAKGLEEINNDVQDSHQALDFCFDSALDIIDRDDKSSIQENPVDVISEGLIQALDKNAALINSLSSYFEEFSNMASFSVNNLIQEILTLQISENLIEINMILTKAKMLSKTKKYKNKFKVLFNDLNKRTKGIFSSLIKSFNKKFQSAKKKLKLTAPPKQISAKLSNFLIESHKNINKLPHVYRRLFELKPVDELNLFLGRSNEIEKINKAYSNWQEGKYAVTLLVGENGSGKTSLINNLIETAKFRYPITFHKVNSIYYSHEDFFTLIQEVLGIETKTKEELDIYFENLDYKKVIIIDGLEKLFLRKVNGYNCLQQLLEFIALSNQKIFWILSSSYYSWNFLNKAIGANDYIDYQIEMGALGEDVIKNIIRKRNRLSGYKLSFLSANEDLKNKKFQKMTSEQQQEILEKKYFIQLNKFAEGNVSLALSSWLNSIVQIKENTLYIQNFTTQEFSFLNSLSSEKIYTLLLAVYHGGISVENHAEIFHHAIEKSRRILLVMNEDAILIKRNESYFINFILFRHIIELLKNKNLIH
jgi:ATPase family protein associated with various cellular activities (AAA)